VGGMPLCQPHAIRECQEILTSPSQFVHGWPGSEEIDTEWHGYVPFDFEVHMIR